MEKIEWNEIWKNQMLKQRVAARGRLRLYMGRKGECKALLGDGSGEELPTHVGIDQLACSSVN